MLWVKPYSAFCGLISKLMKQKTFGLTRGQHPSTSPAPVAAAHGLRLTLERF